MEVDRSQSSEAGLAQSELYLSLGLLAVLVVLIIPLPTMLLDAFLAANLSTSILILLITLNIRRPLEISVFPSLLLLLTLARLSLNVATTRLILLQADAGKIVSTFGGLVVGGNIVVGLVIFLILVVIQFIVITKGTSRISEVAARFTLDALPGKQMAIDAELGAGNIDEATARERRESLSLETEFYGSMDGAGKFVRGDAIAGLVITAINLVGGVIIGMTNGLSIIEAIRTYSTLTIGDGLISQIPGLIIATTAGILVTKATTSTSLGREIGHQVTQHRRPLLVGAIILGALAVVPGLPKIPFVGLSLLLLYFWRKQGKQEEASEEALDAEEAAPGPADQFEKHVQEFLKTDQACIEIGVSLVSLVETGNDRGLVARVTELRGDLARKHGIWVPAVRVRDNIRIDPNSYRIIVNGRQVASGTLHADKMLAIDPGTSTGTLDGMETKDPAFGLPAKWIDPSLKSRGGRMGYTVVDVTTVLITHVGEVLKKFAPELLSREDLSKLLAELRKTSPSLVDEIKPDLIRTSDIHHVIRELLAERVPISNFARVLEAIVHHAHKVKDPHALVEVVRTSIGTEILDPLKNADGMVPAIVAEPKLETGLRERLREGILAIDPASLDRLAKKLNELRQKALATDQELILLVETSLRRPIRNAIERNLPDLIVVGYGEVPNDTQVEFKSILKFEDVFGSESDPATSHMAVAGAA